MMRTHRCQSTRGLGSLCVLLLAVVFTGFGCGRNATSTSSSMIVLSPQVKGSPEFPYVSVAKNEPADAVLAVSAVYLGSGETIETEVRLKKVSSLAWVKRPEFGSMEVKIHGKYAYDEQVGVALSLTCSREQDGVSQRSAEVKILIPFFTDRTGVSGRFAYRAHWSKR
jgi:hypothetical protein